MEKKNNRKNQIPFSDLQSIFNMIGEKAQWAADKYGPFHSAHEAYAILKEEVDELWDAIKMKQTKTERQLLIESESLDVAAMALRIIFENWSNFNNDL